MAMGTSGRFGAVDDERDGAKAAPQAMLHRKVLDVAAANPNASTERIASEVGEASPSFVERVFAEYGDPAEGDRESGPDDGSDDSGPDDGVQSSPGADEASPTGRESGSESAVAQESHADLGFDPSELSAEQVETLRIVHEDPTATQRAVAERLDRDRSTVAKRVNEIPGYEWATRRELVEALFEDGELRLDSGSARANETAVTVTDGAGLDAADGGAGVGGSPDPTAGVADVKPETSGNPEVDSADSAGETNADKDAKAEGDANGQSRLSSDPELVHKVAHACLDAEYIATDEELRILRRLLAGPG